LWNRWSRASAAGRAPRQIEEGTKLLKTCEGRLKDAELRIEQLKKQKDGNLGSKIQTDRDT